MCTQEVSKPGSQQARMAYVLNREDLGKAVECLRAALATYPGRKEPAVMTAKG